MSEESAKTTIDVSATDANAGGDVGKSTSDNVKPRNELSIEIFRLIRNAQKQHGLRHGDYQRYRGTYLHQLWLK